MKIYKILIVLTFLFGFGCTAIFENGGELASVVKQDITQITVDELKAKVDNGEEFLLIDVRQPSEYESGNIPGSFSIPRGELEFMILDEYFWEEQFMYVPLKTDEIIIYCKSGARAALATQSLKKLGFEKVSNLEGGWMAYSGGENIVTQQPTSGGCGD